MKLLLCRKCGDIFNLTRKEKTCGCGETKGRYVDSLNAEIEGDCQPIGFANGSFISALQVQRYENEFVNPGKKKQDCCKGIEFTAFFIPEQAASIHRV